MGLRPVIGRLLDATDDGPRAAGAAVLTYRFWTTAFQSDPSVIGKTIRLGDRSATIIGVLEPSVPYPTETEIIANVVTSPHHLDATMVEGRVHRMTDLFGRLALARTSTRLAPAARGPRRDSPGTSRGVCATGRLPHRCGWAARSDHFTSPNGPAGAARQRRRWSSSSPARTYESDPPRSVRREGELTIRAALGATMSALRRTLLAETCCSAGAGAIMAIILARPMVAVLARMQPAFPCALWM
jgi:hypothetical protein